MRINTLKLENKTLEKMNWWFGLKVSDLRSVFIEAATVLKQSCTRSQGFLFSNAPSGLHKQMNDKRFYL